ncbi:hypothetical protein D9619_004341 [Psilocybe cf. subviscida]|uniref:AB hydrolase-1 domain-containing protein n=1 Tax=Psilocybe cf. subviscida TaxID=2480587 RepID=A0A8H5BQA8_9AGAR|nr:hypothetical protein D9619_004341 [Psilocybe cf. subviscida]
MSTPTLKKYGTYAARDSGAPSDSRDYTTLVLLHGSGWHSAIFEKLFPLVDTLNVRLVAANRPDYPGATPLSEQERMQLNNISETANQDSDSAANALLDYIKENTKKLCDFLAEFILREDVPVEGGIVVAGWSVGAADVLGLLANADAVSSKEVDLRSYIKHLVIYDAPSCILGYAPPTGLCAPLFDPSLTPGEILKVFPLWVSTYYARGEDLTHPEGKALDHPPPTILSMDPSDVQQCLEVNPVLPGGADERLISLGVKLNVFSRLKDGAMYLDKGHPQGGSSWDDIEIKYVWCDQAAWEMPWGVACLQADLDNAKKAGKVTRKVDMCHWDQPQLALTGLLSGL